MGIIQGYAGVVRMSPAYLHDDKAPPPVDLGGLFGDEGVHCEVYRGPGKRFSYHVWAIMGVPRNAD